MTPCRASTILVDMDCISLLVTAEQPGKAQSLLPSTKAICTSSTLDPAAPYLLSGSQKGTPLPANNQHLLIQLHESPHACMGSAQCWPGLGIL